MDHTVAFADQLKQHLPSLRKARRLTQAGLARKLDVSQSRVAQLETNPSAMTMESLFKLLNALDVQLVLRDRSLDASSITRGDPGTFPAKTVPRGEW